MKPKRLFQQGEADVLAGFGLLPTFLKDNISQNIPPLSLRAQSNLFNNYSLGVEFAYSKTTSTKEDLFSDERQYENKYHFVALRNSIHCNCDNLDNWDIYGGFALGLNLVRISVVNGSFGPTEELYGIKPKKNQLTFNGYLGFRYACSSAISFFGEIGYGASFLQAGVGYRLWGG